MNRPELLAPAGSLEKGRFALIYGADAVYFGAEDVSLRAKTAAFPPADIRELVSFAHANDKRVYAAVNGLPRTEDLDVYKDRIRQLAQSGVDAVILASPSLIEWTRQNTALDIHVSTQHGAANAWAAQWLRGLGAKRIVLPRERTVAEIADLAKRTAAELEVFIHGGMCSAISGRCELSAFLSDRDANRGQCAHSCRWEYELCDASGNPVADRPFSLASKDLQTLRLIPSLIASGVASLKIEGRMKSIHYVSTVVQNYRFAIDAAMAGRPIDVAALEDRIARAEIRSSHPGFLLGDSKADGLITTRNPVHETNDFLGIVTAYDEPGRFALVDVRNRIAVGDSIEVLRPDGRTDSFVVRVLEDETGDPLVVANVPKRLVRIHTEMKLDPYDLLRKVKTWNDPY
jgi:putative protease